ncbi:MAG: hypothetical protein ABL958_17770, partial [Bdellovibrionia bacterium]
NQQGAKLSLALWHGSREAMRTTLTNIVKQLYADNDTKDFRFVVDSNPIPEISAIDWDFNTDIRAQAQRQYEMDLAEYNRPDPVGALTGYKLRSERMRPSVPNIAPKMGLQIKISAGMFATLANVDELAGQVAKALAQHNYTVYGAKEDPRFIQNQQYIARYETRIYSWFADVFHEGKNHSLARWLVRKNYYDMTDWTRPLRLQLQTAYVSHLQKRKNSYDIKFDETPFSPKLKKIRFRMKLFTQPYFAGTAYQVSAIALVGGLVASTFIYPQAGHFALEALNQTSEFLHLTSGIQYARDTVGGVVSQAREVTASILDSGYFGFDYSTYSSAARKHVADYFYAYSTALGIGSTAIVAGYFRKYSDSITGLFRALDLSFSRRNVERADLAEARVVEINEAELVPVQVPLRPQEQSAAPAPVIVLEEPRPTMVMGSRPPREPLELGKKIGALFSGMKDTTIDVFRETRAWIGSPRERTGHILASGRENFVVTVANGQETLRRHREALHDYAVAGQHLATLLNKRAHEAAVRARAAGAATASTIRRGAINGAQAARRRGGQAVDLTVRGGQATVAALDATEAALERASDATNAWIRASAVSTWQALGRAALATPGALESARQTTTTVAVRWGNKTWSRGAAVTRWSGRAIKVSSHAVFITAPVAVGRFSAATSVAAWEGSKKQYQAAQVRREERRVRLDTLENRLVAGEKFRGEFFASQELSLEEILKEIEHLFQMRHQHGGTTEDRIRWGLRETEKNLNKSPSQTVKYEVWSLLHRAMNKWVQQAKAKGATDAEMSAMNGLFSRYYAEASVPEKKSPVFVEAGVEFFKLAREVQNPEFKEFFNQHTVNKETFINDMANRVSGAAAAETRDGGESVAPLMNA